MNDRIIALHAVDYANKVSAFARSRTAADKQSMIASQVALVQCVKREILQDDSVRVD